MRRLLLFVLAAVLAAGSLQAQSPSAGWRTIETKHFRVHYPAPFEAWAKRAAGAIEGIHAGVTEFVGYTPERAIDVLVSDPEAEANGLAYPFLDRPVVVLWTSPPAAESGIGFYSDWAELLLTHEIAHIVHLARPRNRAGSLRRLLPIGPVLWNSPRWVAEGYATLVEGALTGSGRPHSSFRAMVLRRFAIEGKLPSYGALSSTGGWLGGSMAYLVGSTYLEWLEEREGKESLQKLWKRMASRRGGSFPAAFRAVFGEPPRDLYDRFVAETTALAIAEEKRLEAAGAVSGELWQRLEGGTLSPQVSPDGSRLLVRRDPERGESFLAIWEIGETEEERKAERRRLEREKKLLEDPQEIADRLESPRPRRPRWRLPRFNGFSASSSRFLPDGKSVLFSRKAPDAEGMLRGDLYIWEYERGQVRRLTRLADLTGADPAPDGRWAVGVRNRYGVGSLVRVDLATGETREIPAGGAAEEPWLVWNHPRVSADGKSVAALLHRGGRWRLVTLPAEGGEVKEIALAGSPAAPPAWSPDGSRLFVTTDASGTWNIAAVNAAGGAPAATLTRVTGGAFSPAPAPDGVSLFFLEFGGKGVNLRRMDLSAAQGLSLDRPSARPPILPPAAAEAASAPRAKGEVSQARSYSVWPSQVARPFVNYTLGPDGKAWQIGLEGADVVGRFLWRAAGSLGDAAGPRGGFAAADYRGLPVELSVHLFSALEKPGSQRVIERPEFDSERRGGFLSAGWGRSFATGSLRLEAGAGAARVDPVANGDAFTRSLASCRARGALRRVRGKTGFVFESSLAGSVGETDGQSWRQLLGEARLSRIQELGRLTLSGAYGDTRGSSTRFDLFAVGGAASSLLPPGLDRNRIESPALPAFTQVGERVEKWRAEFAASSLPVLLYGEWLRAWNGGAPKPDPVRALGAELRLTESFLPIGVSGSLGIYAGVARIRSELPRFRSTRGYAGFLYRP